jgi:hypothetical protein
MIEWLTPFMVLLAFWCYKRCQKPLNFPPGPPRLPILGSVPFLPTNNFLHNSIHLKARYGNVVGLYFGNTPVLIVSDLHLAKELFKQDVASGRPIDPFIGAFPGMEKLAQNFPYLKKARPGVFRTHGGYNKEVRKFILKNLRDLGFGKSTMEAAINHEVANLVNFYESLNGESFDPNQTMNVYIVNALLSILLGGNLCYNDDQALKIAQLVDQFFKYVDITDQKTNFEQSKVSTKDIFGLTLTLDSDPAIF